MGGRPRARLDPREGRRAARRAARGRGTRRRSTSCSRRSGTSASRTRASTSRSPTRTSSRSRRGSFRDLPRRDLRPDLRARRRAWLGRRGSAAAPVQGARGAARPLPGEVRRARHDAGHRLDPRLPPRRGPRHRDARGARLGDRLHLRQQLAAPRVREAGRRGAREGRVRLLRRRDHGAARRGAVRAARRGGLRLGRDARRHRRADRGDPRALPGDHRDRDHGQRRRRAALDGDQEPGAVRLRGDPARPAAEAVKAAQSPS